MSVGKKKEYLVDKDGGWGRSNDYESSNEFTSKRINPSLLEVINNTKIKENKIIREKNSSHTYPCFHKDNCRCNNCEFNKTYNKMVCTCDKCSKYKQIYVIQGNNLIKQDGYGRGDNYDDSYYDKETKKRIKKNVKDVYDDFF